MLWYHSINLIYAETAAKSQYFEVGEIFVNIPFELLFYNQNNHPWKSNVFNFCFNSETLIIQKKNHWKHVQLDKVLDNDCHPPAASVGNITSILNPLKIVSCCPYSTQQHYYLISSATFMSWSVNSETLQRLNLAFCLTNVIRTKTYLYQCKMQFKKLFLIKFVWESIRLCRHFYNNKCWEIS